MRTETEEIRDNLKYLSLLARDYPSQAAAASEIISTQALLKLPKGTEHFMSDLHGENEAFVHILNSASGVIREKVDIVLGDTVPEGTRAELATLIYYPSEKLPQLKERCADEEALEQWYSETLLRLIDICRLVSSKHTREHVRACLPSSCGYILDELLHAHFEDHDKDLYYGQIVGSIIENGRADKFIVRLCELIKRLAVDKLHIVGDLFDRGPRPDVILDLLMRHHDVDIQWGNHDVVWMGAAAGSPICICTVLKTTLSYHNHGMVEDCYGINLRHLQRMAEQFYGDDDLTIWMPHTDTARGPYTPGMLHRCAVMHKAITILMLKLECQVIDRNPDFKMQDRDFLRRINWEKGTVMVGGREYPMRDTSFPTVDPADPTALNSDEKVVLQKLVQSFRQSEKLQQHVEFLYAKGSVYHIENGNLLYHGAVPMTRKGTFAVERWDGRGYPDGLSGHDIPPGSRVIAVADSIDAMMSSRSYRPAMTSAACRREIEKNSGIMYDPRVAAAALEHWDELVSRYAGADTPRTPYFDRLQLEHTRQAHDYLLTHQGSRITLPELAAKFHLSQSSLKICFKALYGVPVASYLRGLRMDTAARLLQESDLPVAEIAHRVGYEDPSRFAAAFRRHTGRRPTELRRVACPTASSHTA